VCFRSGEIQILDKNGAVERTISFNEPDRNLRRQWSSRLQRESQARASPDACDGQGVNNRLIAEMEKFAMRHAAPIRDVVK
jgi:hypothetical protein